MAAVTTHTIQIHYETLGKANRPPLLLISGLGQQMAAWPDDFCRMLVDNGFFVIHFDNRDTGLSAKLDSKGIPDLQAAWEAYFKGVHISPPYTLRDMAADAIAVSDALGIQKAYACGFSLGGMIAQNMAFEFPERLAGMICMGSSTGDLRLPPPSPEAQAIMATPAPPTREEYINHMVWVFRVFTVGQSFMTLHAKPKSPPKATIAVFILSALYAKA